MRREVLTLREPEIRALLDPRSCIAAMEQAFAAYSTGRAQLPAVIHLDIPEGEVAEKQPETRPRKLGARFTSRPDT